MLYGVELGVPGSDARIANQVGGNLRYVRPDFRLSEDVLALEDNPRIGGSGLRVSVTAAAECRAVPLMEASRNMVRCFIWTFAFCRRFGIFINGKFLHLGRRCQDERARGKKPAAAPGTPERIPRAEAGGNSGRIGTFLSLDTFINGKLAELYEKGSFAPVIRICGVIPDIRGSRCGILFYSGLGGRLELGPARQLQTSDDGGQTMSAAESLPGRPTP